MQVQKQIDQLLALRASEWLEVLRSGGEREREQFVTWLGESRLHVQEILEIAAVDRELDRIDPERSEDVEALLRRVAPQVRHIGGGAGIPLLGTPRRRGLRSRPWLAALAACAAVVAIGISVRAWQTERPEEFATTTGEQRAIELADASLVHLNADSSIEVEFGAAGRDVRLVRGEALFKVVRDTKRPFRVHARGGIVQALGTQFNVYARAHGTRVSVLDGRVSITAERTGLVQTLETGEEAQIGLDGTITRHEQADIEDAVAWRQRRLVFDNASLEEIVQEFNRYSRSRQLRIEGVVPGSHRYDGSFDADDPASLAALLAREQDLAVETRDGQIIVRPRSAAADPGSDGNPQANPAAASASHERR